MSKSKIGSILALAGVLVVVISKVVQGLPPSFEEVGLAIAAVLAAFGSPVHG